MLIEDGTILGNGEVLDYNTKIKVILPSWQLLDQNISDHVDVLDLLGKLYVIRLMVVSNMQLCEAGCLDTTSRTGKSALRMSP